MLGSETSTVGSGQNYFGSIDDSDNEWKAHFSHRTWQHISVLRHVYINKICSITT